MKKLFILMAALYCLGAHAQNGVEVFSGFITDTLTTAQLDALPSRVKRKGAHFYNNDINSLVSWNGTEWVPIGGDSAPILITEEDYLLLDPEDRPTNADIISEEEEGSEVGDNLGDHTATQNLDMSNFRIINADTISGSTAPGSKIDMTFTKFYTGMEISSEGQFWSGTMTPLTGSSFSGVNREIVTTDNRWGISKRSSQVEMFFDFDGITADRTLEVPDASGELALRTFDSGSTGIVVEGATSGTYTAGTQAWRWERVGDRVTFRIILNAYEGTDPTGIFTIDLSGTTFPVIDNWQLFNVDLSNITLSYYSIICKVESGTNLALLVRNSNSGNSSYVSDLDLTSSSGIMISGTYLAND